MFEPLRRLFDNSEFMPHGRCWAWDPWVVWTNVLSDIVIAGSYLVIALTLAWFVRRRRDLAFNWMFLAFATFILACGLTHAMEVINTWNGYFRMAGIVKIVTAMASLPTALLLIRIMPEAMAVPTPSGMARINQSLRESEEGLRRIIDSVQDYAIFMLDPEGRVKSWNAGAAKLKGYSAEEVLGQPFALFYPPEDHDRAAKGLEVALREGRFEEEAWRVRKDGSRFMAHVVLSPIRGQEGELLGYVKVTQDITEFWESRQQEKDYREDLERRVEARTREVRERHQELERVFQSIQDPLAIIAVADGPGSWRVDRCNAACGEAWGEAPERLLGRSIQDILSPPKEPVLAAMKEAIDSQREQRLERASMDRVFDVRISPLMDEQGRCTHLVIVSRDLTERVRMEEAVRESQKLESLGVLAGGIAHDFNNLLTSVLGNANLGSLLLPIESPAKPYLESIERAGLRAADLTRQLLAYAGKGSFIVGRVDLNKVVQEMTQLLSVSISKKAALSYDLSEWPPVVKGDPAQIQQLVMNLVTNASEAIGDEKSGIITLRTGRQVVDETYLHTLSPVLAMDSGEYATLEVTDTGCGMAPEVLNHIFEPFFTTKFTGRGLGLSAMIGILRSHRGSLKVYSEVGRGTTFKLFLPLSEAAPIPEEDAWAVGRSPKVGDRVMLVVDDEAEARAVATRMAELVGFRVIQAADGREAVEIFRRHHKNLALVLTDLTMPHMDGREAFQKMRLIDATVPVILSSGYSESAAAQAFVGQGLVGFLQKPYRHQDFLDLVKKALERPREA